MARFSKAKVGAPPRLGKGAAALYVALGPDIFRARKEGTTQWRGGIKNCKVIKRDKEQWVGPQRKRMENIFKQAMRIKLFSSLREKALTVPILPL